MWRNGTRCITRVLPGTLLVFVLLMAWSGAVSAMTPVGTLITNSCTLTRQAGGTVVTASWVMAMGNWIAVDGDTLVAATAGETAWLPFRTTNESSLTDTVTLAAVSRLGWHTQLYDSAGLAPLPAVQQLAADQVLQFWVAVWRPGSTGGAADWPGERFFLATATAFDSATAVIQRSGQQLHHFMLAAAPQVAALAAFGIGAPPAIYAAVAFSITVTAYDSDSNPIDAYVAAAPLHVDSGTVAPGALAAAGWSHGVWNGTLTISDCFDTVHLGISDAGVTDTVAIMVIQYRLALDQAVYHGLAGPMRISVADAVQDTPPGVINTVRVRVTSDADAAGITVTLTETGLTTGFFTGNVRFTQGPSQGDAIRVGNGGMVTVTYDPDGSDTVPAVSAQATWLALAVSDLERVRSWPNPYYPDRDGDVTIHQLPSDPGMVIEIYNIAAQLLRTLRAGEEISVTAPENVARWDGRSESGQMVASGTYVYVVKSANGTVVRKLTLIR